MGINGIHVDITIIFSHFFLGISNGTIGDLSWDFRASLAPGFLMFFFGDICWFSNGFFLMVFDGV